MGNSDLLDRIWSLRKKINPQNLLLKIEEIETEMGRPGFWQDQVLSRQKTQELAEIKKDLENWGKIDSLLERNDWVNLERIVAELELKTFFSQPYDQNVAILTIHAGQGGVEAMDWAQMLQRMYLRYAEKRGWQVDVVDLSPGEEAGVKSVTMRILGPYAYGYLRREAGVHRLVRQSPFNADRLRQTSFALVEVLPEIEESPEIDILESDLEWEFFRASSQGGQNVQKVSSAVRLRHKPTGIVLTCQSERYQEQNRKIALSLLRAKLWAIAETRAKGEEKRLKGEVKIAGWGNQIRSYVLHPYKMVKDLRTGVETPDPEKVLDGELDLFIEAELRSVV